jgi:hypothetical protein
LRLAQFKFSIRTKIVGRHDQVVMQHEREDQETSRRVVG